MTGLRPPVDGVSLVPVENGSRVRLTVTGNHTVVVKGYDEEPYLRVDSTGVWQNTLSPATYLNRDRYGSSGSVPAGDSRAAKATPRWEKIADGRTVVWHDHRAHWMGTQDPPAVKAAPGRFHQIYAWTIPLTVDDQAVLTAGTLDWVPGPSPVPWLVLTVAVAAAVAASGLYQRRDAALAAAVTVIVGVDVTHSVLVACSRASGRLSGFVYGNIVEMTAWILGLAAAVLLLRRSSAGRYLAGTAGFVIAMVGGFGDLGVLYRSSAPIAGPIGLARTLTAVTIGIGLGLLAATALASRQRASRGPGGTGRKSRHHSDPGQAGPDHAGLPHDGRQPADMLPTRRDMAS
ncbi:hypothetical protein [Protofrankia coriariae]|uniref:Uncharacterized protein n=1 Tax=Protofrankia coriariae TaxID=1562887 RepID=A0ABR5F2L3_9ACTN|nr:hypothetical protein [Protofrankia coriariae]KLL10935.1 hypothetical protein FrCorBMG51_14255 [Protofrankia coriariae]